MLNELRRNPREMTRKMIIIGEGARIPEIEVLFQKKLNIKTEAKSLVPSRNDFTMPVTAYGMALSIVKGMKADIQL